MKVALIQFDADSNKSENIRRAEKYVYEAARRGSRFVVLPEVFVYRGKAGPEAIRIVADDVGGETLNSFRRIAVEQKIYILAGSIWERNRGQKKVYNTSVLINPSGKIAATYRKMHLFEARVSNVGISEAKTFLPGTKPVMARVDEFRVGLSICYDLRFPEMYLQYNARGADVLCVPSAFTHETGKAHWEILLRARAIENLCYVLAPNQAGVDGKGTRHYGHSMIVDPWGKIIAQSPASGEGIIMADVNRREIDGARRKLPGLSKRKI